jgi:hypothetical protein
MSRYYHYETFGNKALGHVNIFELQDVCGVELFDFEGIKISGYLNSEKVIHIIYFWLKRTGEPMIINFVDDSDRRTLKNKLSSEDIVVSESDRKAIKEFANGISRKKGRTSGIMQGIIDEGFIVNDKKKQYFDLETVNLYTGSIAPLAILTGDPEVLRDELDTEIKIAGSWADEEIKYASEVPEGYEDISRKLQYFL